MAESRAAKAGVVVQKALLELNQLMGRRADAPLIVKRGPLDARPAPALISLLGSAMQNHYDLRVRRAELEQQGFKVELAKNERYPAFTIGPFVEVQNTRTLDDQTVAGVGISFPLPFWKNGKAEVSNAEARQMQAQATLAAAQREVERQVTESMLIYQTQQARLAVWKGDAVTGVTIFQIEPALDSGPMVGKVETPIGESETSGELMLRLAELSVPLTLLVVRQLADGTATFELQDSSHVTFAPKILREAGSIDWSKTRREIDCHVRAMQPWPKASSALLRNGHPPLRCIVQQVVPRPDIVPLSPGPEVGSVTEFAGRLFVATGDGWLEILRLQPEGRKSTDGRSFVNGYPLQSGDRFE